MLTRFLRHISNAAASSYASPLAWGTTMTQHILHVGMLSVATEHARRQARR